jgi:hypothetical protein
MLRFLGHSRRLGPVLLVAFILAVGLAANGCGKGHSGQVDQQAAAPPPTGSVPQERAPEPDQHSTPSPDSRQQEPQRHPDAVDRMSGQPAPTEIAAGDTLPVSGAPKIVLAEESFDFGVIPQGEKVQHIFKVLNEGDAPLKLIRAKGS